MTTLPWKRGSVFETMLAVEIGEAETERLGRILHAGEARRIARLRQPLRQRLLGAQRRQRLVLVLHDGERAVGARRQLEAQRTRAGEVAQRRTCRRDTCRSACRCRRRCAESPPTLRRPTGGRSAATPTSPFELFRPGRSTGPRSTGCCASPTSTGGEALRLERIRRAARAARVLAFEPAVLQRRLELRAVLVEAERSARRSRTDRSSTSTLSSPLKNDPFGAAHADAGTDDLEAERDVNGTGSAPAGAVLTTTVASHRPAGRSARRIDATPRPATSPEHDRRTRRTDRADSPTVRPS